MSPTALIAEDEPLLAKSLHKGLAKVWPALQVVAVCRDGRSAIERASELRPDIVFLDIQMPEHNGLEVAETIVDERPSALALPLIVFVTAFDQYALDAFERSAVDYILKPVAAERLSVTCDRLRKRLAERHTNLDEASLGPLRSLFGSLRGGVDPAPLEFIQASVGSTLHMVNIADVLYFSAEDKYVRVVTAQRDYLIRTPLRDLAQRLSPQTFWQIHRCCIVKVGLIKQVTRDETGKQFVELAGRAERLQVSRTHAHLFKGM